MCLSWTNSISLGPRRVYFCRPSNDLKVARISPSVLCPSPRISLSTFSNLHPHSGSMMTWVMKDMSKRYFESSSVV